MNKNKYLLVKGRAGLGNRMLSALTGILYARLSGRRLIIDWSDYTYSDDGSNVFPRFFQCPLYDQTDEIPDTNSVSPDIWRSNLNESAIDLSNRYSNDRGSEVWRKFSIDLKRLDYREDVVVMWAYTQQIDLLRSHFTGAFEEYSRLDTKCLLTKLIREELILYPRIRERVEEFKAHNFIKKTVGVHVRYTDHRASLWSILNRLNMLIKIEPDLQIFLATDNIQIQRIFEESYPNVIATPHWYPSPGLPTHQNEYCLNRMENGIEALVDLYLLAECDYLIIDSSSSFSNVADLLAKTDPSKVFDVRQRGKLPARIRTITWRILIKLGFFSWGPSALKKLMRMLAPMKVGRSG